MAKLIKTKSGKEIALPILLNVQRSILVNLNTARKETDNRLQKPKQVFVWVF